MQGRSLTLSSGWQATQVGPWEGAGFSLLEVAPTPGTRASWQALQVLQTGDSKATIVSARQSHPPKGSDKWRDRTTNSWAPPGKDALSLRKWARIPYHAATPQITKDKLTSPPRRGFRGAVNANGFAQVEIKDLLAPPALE